MSTVGSTLSISECVATTSIMAVPSPDLLAMSRLGAEAQLDFAAVWMIRLQSWPG